MQQKTDSVLLRELRQFLPAFGSIAIFSFVLALMYLVPSIYMQQLFERVFQSRSLETLIFLSTIVVFLCIMWTAIEIVRIRVLQRIGIALSDRIDIRVFDALARGADSVLSVPRNVALQDLKAIRDFFAGSLLLQILDLMWVPVIIFAAALYHWILGLTLALLALVVALLAAVNQFVVRHDTTRSLTNAARASEFGRAVMNNAEPMRVMGMMPALSLAWHKAEQTTLGWQAAAERRSTAISSTIRFLRHVYLPIMLFVGTLLYLSEAAGAGVIFAASVLTARAIYPVDGIASSWRQLWSLRFSLTRINQILNEAAKQPAKVRLEVPRGALAASHIAVVPPQRKQAVLTDVSFSIQPGQALGIVGPSGAGKSSLARALVGAWPLQRGSLVLDGNELSHWDQDQLGRRIGYVPQDVDWVPGTVAENIARFDPASEERDRALHAAIRISGIQDIVQKLPNGLNTRLGSDGHMLSGEQRQRIALARAVYGDPHLLVLDEPNSNLDAIGEDHLGRTINAMRENGAIVVVITHRTNLLAYCDDVLVLNAGTVHAFGRREAILERLRPTPQKQVATITASTIIAA